MDLTAFFNKLTAKLNLGEMLCDSTQVSGGLMHMMYKLQTSTGIYVVKLLNPAIMKRPDAMGNYMEAQRLESILEKNNIPIIPSISFNQTKMQSIENQYFYVYKWYDGKILNNKDINKLHCEKISTVLSNIHCIESYNEENSYTPLNINWDNYINIANGKCHTIYELLTNNINLLNQMQFNGNNAIKNIPNNKTICHNDMDCKNVLWNGDDFKIIDLECLGYANPYLELFELALCWSGFYSCNVDFLLLKQFIDSYFYNKTKPNLDWEAIYLSNYSRLEWLCYNVKRGLMIECTTIEEQELGINQCEKTIESILYYHNIKNKILTSLNT